MYFSLIDVCTCTIFPVSSLLFCFGKSLDPSNFNIVIFSVHRNYLMST